MKNHANRDVQQPSFIPFVEYSTDPATGLEQVRFGDAAPSPVVRVSGASDLPHPDDFDTWHSAVYIAPPSKKEPATDSQPSYTWDPFAQPRWRDESSSKAEETAPRRQWFVPAPEKPVRPYGFISDAQALRDRPAALPQDRIEKIAEQAVPAGNEHTAWFTEICINNEFIDEPDETGDPKRPLRDVILNDYLGFPEGDSPIEVIKTDAWRLAQSAKDAAHMTHDLVAEIAELAKDHVEDIRRVAVPVAAGIIALATVGQIVPDAHTEQATDDIELVGVSLTRTENKISLNVPGGTEQLYDNQQIKARISTIMNVSPTDVKISGETVSIHIPEGKQGAITSETINDAVDVLLPLVVQPSEETTTTTSEGTTTTTTKSETPDTEPVTPSTPADPEAPAATTELEQKQQSVVSNAAKYLGITEDPDTPNHSQQIDELFQMGLTGKKAEWCASFVSRVLLDAGVPMDGGETDGHKGPEWQLEFVNSVYKWVSENGGEIYDQQQIRDGFVPSPGDLVVYNVDGELGDNGSGVNHIGVVDHYDPATDTLFTIEGNFNNAVSDRNYVMHAKLDSARGKKLAGFLRIPSLIDTPETQSPETPAPTQPETPPAAPLETQPSAAERLGNAQAAFLDNIASGEGGWDSFNHGKSGDAHGNYTLEDGRTISQLTIAEVLELQANKKLFAVGRYQFIPGTLRSAVKSTGIDVNRLFDAAAQNELAINYLIMTKRPVLAGFIKGEHQDVEAAANAAAMEWASLPYHFKNGTYGSFYAGRGNNHARGGEARYQLIKQQLFEYQVAYALANNEAQSNKEIV